MDRFRHQMELFKQTPKEPPHSLLKYYKFPPVLFNITENRDYTRYSVVVKKRGGRNYYIAFGWLRFGLHIKNSGEIFNKSTCVGFYTAEIRIIKEICISRRFPSDENLPIGISNQYVYLTPYIDHLEFSGAICEVPRDLGLNMGGFRNFRVVLQCRVPSHLILEIPDPSPYYSQNIRENSVWRVPANSVFPYAICIKELESN